jgi:hypothetical protein
MTAQLAEDPGGDGGAGGAGGVGVGGVGVGVGVGVGDGPPRHQVFFLWTLHLALLSWAWHLWVLDRQPVQWYLAHFDGFPAFPASLIEARKTRRMTTT